MATTYLNTSSPKQNTNGQSYMGSPKVKLGVFTESRKYPAPKSE
jgi:hypothetical protein